MGLELIEEGFPLPSLMIQGRQFRGGSCLGIEDTGDHAIERLRAGNIQAFLDLRNEVAARAAASGLTEERLAELLTADEA